MSTAPQGQKPQAQKSDYSNQSNAGKVGNNIRKDEPTAKAGKDGMKNEGGSCSTSSNKASDCGTKSAKV